MWTRLYEMRIVSFFLGGGGGKSLRGVAKSQKTKSQLTGIRAVYFYQERGHVQKE